MVQMARRWATSGQRNGSLPLSPTVFRCRTTVLYDCHKVYPFQTEIRGMAIYTVPKVGVQLSGTMQSRPGPEITALWNVPASVIAQSLGRLPAGGVANIQTNILTAGELYGDRITQIDF